MFIPDALFPVDVLYWVASSDHLFCFFFFASGLFGRALPVTSVLAVTAQTPRVDCLKQRNVNEVSLHAAFHGWDLFPLLTV